MSAKTGSLEDSVKDISMSGLNDNDVSRRSPKADARLR